MNLRRRSTAWALVLTFAVAACSGPTEGPEPAHGNPDRTTSSGGSQEATLPPGFAECPTEVKGLDDAPADLSSYRFDPPSGFSAQGGYAQIEESEGEYLADYLVLDGRNLDLLAVVFYAQLAQGPVTNGCGQLLPDVVEERIRADAVAAGARLIGDIEWTAVGGYPAAVSVTEYPDYAITVRNYAIYGENQLLNLGCQWQQDEVAIASGCAQLLAGFSF